MRRDPPEGAEWRWVSKRFGVSYNFERKVHMWSWKWRSFVWVRDYRRAWSIGVYVAGRFYGWHRLACG